MAKKRDIVGRKIVGIVWNYFDTGRTDPSKTTDPVLILDNGTRLSFVVRETEVGEYGIEVSVHKPSEVKGQ
jgi:hypothetical protein